MKNLMKKKILACHDLSVGYKDKAVLAHVNLSFEAGQFISLLGPNGTGKTTLLRTLSGHLNPLCGHIDIQGTRLDRLSAVDLAKFMAVVLTDKVSPPLFSVSEFVSLGRYPHTDFLGRMTPADHIAVQNALAAVHAEGLAQRTFANLSDGERQKALIARALAQEPRLLLLDEPTIHLDLKHRMEVMAILRDLCREKGISVVASLHDLDLAAKVSDRVALVKAGRISAWGLPEEILQKESVAELYDFSRADFDLHLGSIELRSSGSAGRVFAVAGMGSGAVVYRLLAKRGLALTTGVLHSNDLDFFVARSLGAQCIIQAPMERINRPSLENAKDQLQQCDLVIDCGFQLGGLNQANIELLQHALTIGKTVLSLRKQGGEDLFSGHNLIDWTRCDNPVRLMNTLDNLLQTIANSSAATEKKAS